MPHCLQQVITIKVSTLYEILTLLLTERGGLPLALQATAGNWLLTARQVRLAPDWDFLSVTVKRRKNWQGNYYLTFVSMALGVEPTSCVKPSPYKRHTCLPCRDRWVALPQNPTPRHTHIFSHTVIHLAFFLPGRRKGLAPKIKFKKCPLKKVAMYLGGRWGV